MEWFEIKNNIRNSEYGMKIQYFPENSERLVALKINVLFLFSEWLFVSNTKNPPQKTQKKQTTPPPPQKKK